MSLHQDPTQTAVRRQKRSLWTDAWRRMRRSHTAVIGMILFALIVIVCFSAPLFSDYDAQVINSDIALIRKYPVEGHPLGTDELGRDLLLRILWGRPHVHYHRAGRDGRFLRAWHYSGCDPRLLRRRDGQHHHAHTGRVHGDRPCCS